MTENTDNQVTNSTTSNEVSEKRIVYTEQYFKGVPADVKKLIYNTAAQIASGFLSFDSTQVGGSGGGTLFLTGRLAMLQQAHPWVLTIAAQMAEYLGIYSKESVQKQAMNIIKTESGNSSNVKFEEAPNLDDYKNADKDLTEEEKDTTTVEEQ